MVFIFVQSALPADLSQQESNFLVPFIRNLFQVNDETASFLIRKTAHFLEYSVLGLSLTVTVRSLWKGEEKGPLDRRSLVSWGIGTLYAVTDEFHQQFVSGRSCELRDMLIDCGGVLLGVLILAFICFLRGKRTHSTDV